MYTTVTNSENIIDSRDVIERLGELETELEYLREGEMEVDEDVQEEYDMLRAFADEGEMNCEDWDHGEMLIHESYFTEYAEELAQDLYGADIVDAVWPYNHIDWDEAAEALKQDYSELDFGGQTYYAR